MASDWSWMQKFCRLQQRVISRQPKLSKVTSVPDSRQFQSAVRGGGRPAGLTVRQCRQEKSPGSWSSADWSGLAGTVYQPVRPTSRPGACRDTAGPVTYGAAASPACRHADGRGAALQADSPQSIRSHLADMS